MPFGCKQAGHNVRKYDLITFSIQETYTIMQGHYKYKAYYKIFYLSINHSMKTPLATVTTKRRNRGTAREGSGPISGTDSRPSYPSKC